MLTVTVDVNVRDDVDLNIPLSGGVIDGVCLPACLWREALLLDSHGEALVEFLFLRANLEAAPHELGLTLRHVPSQRLRVVGPCPVAL